MRTIRTKVYKFSELSEQAKGKAIENYRNGSVDTDFIYDQAHETVKAFHEIFGTEQGRNSWLDCRCGHIDDNIANLKGLRLRTYIINNFWNDLFNGRYFSLWSKTEVSYKHHSEGHPVLKSRHSKVMFDNSCTLTGVCYDMSLLDPIYNFVAYKDKPDYYSYMDFETLMNDCFDSLKNDVESEVDSQYEDEQIIESIEANEYEFTKDGKQF